MRVARRWGCVTSRVVAVVGDSQINSAETQNGTLRHTNRAESYGLSKLALVMFWSWKQTTTFPLIGLIPVHDVGSWSYSSDQW